MKNYILLVSITALFYSCAEAAKEDSSSEVDSENSINSKENQSEASTEDLEVSLEQLGGLFNTGDKEEGDTKPEVEALKKLLQMSGSSEDGSMGSLQEMISMEVILDLLEDSGVSREEMEKLINNPDSLKILAQEAIKNREQARLVKEGNIAKGRISKEQLASKNTATGVSLEEAILLVQAESGPEATMAKLKKIDSLAGTNVMEQLDLTEAGYLMQDVAGKNEAPASGVELEKIEALRKLSGQLHSDKEAVELLAQLEKTEEAIASGELKASPRYQRTIEHQRKAVKIFKKDFERKARAAKKKFKQLNPNLYFGEEAGQTYVGHMRKVVYLPLGKLSFADRVVNAKHPKLMTQQKNNVLGEPDVIKGFDVEDISGIHSLGLGGTLTIQFIDNALTNVNGPDLYIFEIGQIEPTNLEISKDGKTWVKVGKIDGGVSEVDIAPFVKQGELFYYVRLTDLKMDSGLPGADVDAIAAIGAAMRLNLDSKVLFATGKSVLKPEGIDALKTLAKSISVLKKGSVIVEGHTDDVGSEATNQKLSLARAKSVSAELKKLMPGVDFRWKEKGLGESKPLVENNSDENRTKNRRVEVLVLPN
ncbi:OmpA family protein [Flagellimonas sp. CMM7]|uniref:OmpA family protein n=1 Tax=Flagellimonas sp. CMM7 TaxID=2654676 RepID=UPI0013D2E909|nr:OmpA family protein [Flagellimonas sp. CMM7]UII79832.1 OmpA family protein [Flagellimonas sp. CMM7]